MLVVLNKSNVKDVEHKGVKISKSIYNSLKDNKEIIASVSACVKRKAIYVRPYTNDKYTIVDGNIRLNPNRTITHNTQHRDKVTGRYSKEVD